MNFHACRRFNALYARRGSYYFSQNINIPASQFRIGKANPPLRASAISEIVMHNQLAFPVVLAASVAVSISLAAMTAGIA
jgi:hypothetical protein